MKPIHLSLLVSLALMSTIASAQTTGYAPVNGMKMYYEVHGKGDPVIVLHGAYMTIEGPIRSFVNELAKTRQVIVVETQGHGRTADIERDITYESMADDVAALIRHLKLDSVDVFGYSMGGGTALQFAIRHPKMLRKLVVTSASYTSDGVYPELWQFIPMITPEVFEGSPFKKEYDSIAPNPANFPKLVERLKKLDMQPFDWGAENIKAIKSPTLIIIGDADIVKPEHAVEMLQLLGGGVVGDMAGIPASQLAILPGTSHLGVMERLTTLESMVTTFLDAPMPGTTYDVIVTRVFDAPIKDVWNAWVKPEKVKQWWGPNGFTCPVAEMDVRVGGTSLVCMRAPAEFGGMDMYNTWTYTAIVPNERMEYIFRFTDKDRNVKLPQELGLPTGIPGEVPHVVTFKSLASNKTEVTVTESGYTNLAVVAQSRMGMEQCLEKMAGMLVK